MSCTGCSFLITVGAQVIVVADQALVTSSSKVAFKTRIAAHTFMATHYFSLRGRAYTHNCDKRTHTIPCTENTGTLCCVASSFPFLLQQHSKVCSYYFFFPAAGPVHDGVTQKVIILLHLSPAVHGLARSINSTTRIFSHPCEILTRIFTTIFDTRCGLCLYFLGTLPTKSKNERTNEREKESRHCCFLTHTSHWETMAIT